MHHAIDRIATAPEPLDAPDSRPPRKEAVHAAVLWGLALISTVGLSTWVGSYDTQSVWGVPRWALFGIFGPWVLFFVLHLRFFLRRPPRNLPD